MAIFAGSCHCGSIAVELETQAMPQDMPLRACQCSFCRMHQALAVSDPAGELRFRERDPGRLHLYRFALGTADFVLCANCGAYAGAVLEEEGKSVGILNIRLLDRASEFTAQPMPMNYDGENQDGRVSRRLEKWMPAAIERGVR
ncbi:MAG: hypothetical protein AAF441_09355 [Pseudomonadota bacterium]